MKILSKILHMFKITLEVIFVIIFIFFEELVWKKFAVPIRDWLASLKILQTVQIKIEEKTAYQTLVIFLGLFIVVELAGIYAGILALQGALIWAGILYASKIPLAGFTFWIFGFTKDKLLTIDWFDSLYSLVLRLFNFIKSTRIYRKVNYSVYRTKRVFKNMKKSSLKNDINHVYVNLTNIFKGADRV